MSAFLTLAPIQSASFPSSASPRASVSSPSSVTASPVDGAAVVDAITPVSKERRSSSTDTRFLKLGPVHYGGEPGVGDYADE